MRCLSCFWLQNRSAAWHSRVGDLQQTCARSNEPFCYNICTFCIEMESRASSTSKLCCQLKQLGMLPPGPAMAPCFRWKGEGKWSLSHKKKFPAFQTLEGDFWYFGGTTPALLILWNTWGNWPRNSTFHSGQDLNPKPREGREKPEQTDGNKFLPQFSLTLSLDLRYREKVSQCDGGKTNYWQFWKFWKSMFKCGIAVEVTQCEGKILKVE